MQNLWQKKLKLNYSKKVIDIVQFGSSIVNQKEYNDIDIAVIFDKISLKEQLNESQKIKKQLQDFLNIPIHIKSFDFYSLLNKSNFAKNNILFYGKSLVNGKYFIERFGLRPKILISYSLKKLAKKDKIKMNYLISGKKDNYGLIRRYNGKLLSPGLLEIDPEFENIFLKSMKKITNDINIIRVIKEI